MTGLQKSSRAYGGSLIAMCVLAAPLPLAAQTSETQPENPVAEEVAEEVSEDVQSLNTNELEPLAGTDVFDESAPMSEMADFGVAWPDMSEVGDSPVGQIGSTVSINTEQRYNVVLNGLDDVEQGGDIRSQFSALSLLEENDGDPAVVAQIDRRADADRELMRQVMRSHGYYDAQIVVELVGESGSERIDVVFAIEPGPLYRFESVEMPGLASAGDRTDELREQFPVARDDAVDAADVGAAQVRLADELGNRGYPFAEVGEETVVVDHANRIARLTQPVTPGGERSYGEIVVTEGAESVFDADHVATIARFEPGQLYSDDMLDDLRRALIQTGLVSRVDLTPVEGSGDDLVDISVAMQPSRHRTIAGEIGYGTGEGARVEGSWEHRNLLGPEGAFGVRAIAGTDEQFFGVNTRFSNFTARDHIFSAQLFTSNINRNAFDARTAGFTASFERVTNQVWQKRWYWSVGAEILASDERDVVGALGQTGRQTFLIGALPVSLNFDSTNDLLNPEQGFRLSAFVSPELSFQNGTFGYVRVQLDGSAYLQLMDSLTFAGRARYGAIPGAGANRIAPSRRFYAGGGGSVRGYGYQEIGPRDINNDPIGGRSLIELALEARYRFGNFGIVPFIDAGAVYTDLYPDFTNLRFGAGLGVRYYSSFGPIRIDVGTPLNPQPGDPIVAVYVSLGQAF